MFNKILLAYDGSDGAKLALEKVVDFAKLANAELHLLAVGRIPEYAETVSETEEAREQARSYYSKIMEDAADHLKQGGLSAKVHIDFGKPADTILRIAEELKVDLVVLGTHPHTAVRRRFLGATVDKVIDHAHCSVLVIRK
ncbi:MAG TPA: universal stress protein [Candidatus Binatia bacterium]|jgi:nucleotide-binding universal stress UspA family protein|nr:universal stress protein [Candidatus Binatia bacterium]